MIHYRHADPRFPFLWESNDQPPGPVQYFADTPDGAWAEFLRHEGIRADAELVNLRRAARRCTRRNCARGFWHQAGLRRLDGGVRGPSPFGSTKARPAPLTLWRRVFSRFRPHRVLPLSWQASATFQDFCRIHEAALDWAEVRTR
jgi:hypothetical protein